MTNKIRGVAKRQLISPLHKAWVRATEIAELEGRLIAMFTEEGSYRLFGDDATTAARVLGLVLEGRKLLPMLNISGAAMPSLMVKLIAAGHKVTAVGGPPVAAIAEGHYRAHVEVTGTATIPAIQAALN